MRIIFIVWMLAGSVAAWGASHAEILVLHSYSQEYPWTKRQHEGFLQALQVPPALPSMLRTEYLDTKRVQYDAAYRRMFLQYLASKYRDYRPDAIYVSDDNAASFALNELRQLFVGVPVFFSGVNDLAMQAQLDPSQMTGVFEQKRIEPGLELVRMLAGQPADILVVGDASETFHLIRRDIEEQLAGNTDIHAEYVSNAKLDGLVAQLHGRHERYLFLTTLGAMQELDGRPAALDRSIDAIVAAGDFVVFSMEDVYMRPGVLGGYVTSGLRQGQEAGMQLKRHLLGAAMTSLAPIVESPNEYLIDAMELARNKLTLPAAIAAQAVLINRPVGFFDRYRNLLIASLYGLALALLVVLAGSLLLLMRKNRVVAATSRELARQADDLRVVQESLGRAQRIGEMGNWDWNLADNSLYWSEGIYRLFGIDSGQFGASYEAFLARVHVDDRPMLQQAVQQSLDNGRDYEMVHRIVRPDGEIRMVRELGEVVRDSTGKPLRMIGVVQDVTEHLRIEQALRDKERHLMRLAHFDQLTGLPNRIALMNRLNAATNQQEEQLALMFLDLDRFKPVNDSLGHAVGDQLLQVVGQRLKSALPSSCEVFRLGGDEFVILMTGQADEVEVIPVLQRLLVQLQQPFIIADHRLHLSGSIGIACYPSHGEDAATLLKHADVAMYEAKQEGRNGYQFYRPDMTEQVMHRMQLESELRDALVEQQLQFHYQPLIAVESGRIVGAEALLRWISADGRAIPPDHFIPLAEETGLILQLGEWVLEEACNAVQRWHGAGQLDDDFKLNINISGRQLHQPDFAQVTAAILERTGAPAALLMLELTESTVMSASSKILDTLESLRDLGLQIAIDDFGTGYSSLAHLKQLPISEIKIDRSFVSDISHDSNDEAIASAVIALAHSLGLKVVAEGVETKLQEQFLRERGCPLMQGYLYSRPVPETQFLQLLQANRRQHDRLLVGS